MDKEVLRTMREDLKRSQDLIDKTLARVRQEEHTPTATKTASDYFMDTLKANLDNENLDDSQFRQFLRNTLKDI